ncbi:MAG: homoserine O-acetyltransferase, partial [Coriobacteriia bacterium]|nr:homoserine O-acetyltransferase [Coriobacteriia bacterium]
LEPRFLFTSFTSDWLFPTHETREIVDALRAGGGRVSFAEIDSPYGHDAFLLEPEQQAAYVVPFLASVYAEESAARSSGGTR